MSHCIAVVKTWQTSVAFACGIHPAYSLAYNELYINGYVTNMSHLVTVADTGGLQWFQLKPPLKIARTPNLLTSRRVGDKIATSYT